MLEKESAVLLIPCGFSRLEFRSFESEELYLEAQFPEIGREKKLELPGGRHWGQRTSPTP